MADSQLHALVAASSSATFAIETLHDKLEDVIMGRGDSDDQGLFEAMRICISKLNTSLTQALEILDDTTFPASTDSRPAASIVGAQEGSHV
jgi:hypothetical protein